MESIGMASRVELLEEGREREKERERERERVFPSAAVHREWPSPPANARRTGSSTLGLVVGLGRWCVGAVGSGLVTCASEILWM